MAKTFKRDLSGLRFGRLVVRGFSPDATRDTRWVCACDCGSVVTVIGQAMIRGLTRSCGCLNAEAVRARAIRHAQAGHRSVDRTGAYKSWASMMTRCEWAASKNWQHYGAKGIRVCEKWRDFSGFYEDMGDRPDGCSIDRIDGSKGYEPGNCRWATREQQNLNTSRTIKVVYRGELVTVDSLCRSLGLSKAAVRARASRRGNDYVSALRSVGVEVSAREDAWL